MRRLGWVIGLVAVTAAVASGCVAGHALSTIRHPAPETGGKALLNEVRREFHQVRSSRYQHITEVNADTGEFYFDCSGFLDYALARSRSRALASVPMTANSGRQLAPDYQRYLQWLDQGGSSDSWRAVRAVTQLRSGDVIAWRTAPGPQSQQPSHVMVVLDPPVPDQGHRGQWLVTVADSATVPHAHDVRYGADGLGTGIIGLETDPTGRPTGFMWRGGKTHLAQPAEIALGRPV
jgi:hypothetical protein